MSKMLPTQLLDGNAEIIDGSAVDRKRLEMRILIDNMLSLRSDISDKLWKAISTPDASETSKLLADAKALGKRLDSKWAEVLPRFVFLETV